MSMDIDRMATMARHGAAADPDAALALIARIRESEKERDDHEQARTMLEEALGDVMLERDAAIEREAALAAHVEWLTHQIEGALRIKDLWLPFHCEPEHEGECQALAAMHTGFTNALAEKPDTAAITRRNLIKQAEALEAEAENGDYSAFARQRMLDGAEHYRQQAEASE